MKYESEQVGRLVWPVAPATDPGDASERTSNWVDCSIVSEIDFEIVLGSAQTLTATPECSFRRGAAGSEIPLKRDDGSGTLSVSTFTSPSATRHIITVPSRGGMIRLKATPGGAASVEISALKRVIS